MRSARPCLSQKQQSPYMNLSQQYELISNKGKYIGVRSYYNYTINLYLLEDTFYENHKFHI